MTAGTDSDTDTGVTTNNGATATDIEQDLQRRLAAASRRAGRRFRVETSTADKARIHAAELRRVGVRDPRFAAALLALYEELDLVEVGTGSRSSRRRPVIGRARRNTAPAALPQ